MKLIKLTKILFPFAIALAVILSFSVKNNFTSEYENQIGVMNEDTISKKEVLEFVENNLVAPFEDLRRVVIDNSINPCFENKFKFHFNYEEEEELPFYHNQMISGEVRESDCETDHFIYSVKINYDEKKILVRTSARDQWIPSEEYIKNYKTANNL